MPSLVGLGHETRHVARGVAGVGLGEDQAGDVGRGGLLVLELVDTDELDVGVRLGGGHRGLGHEEADSDDRVVLLVGELLEVVRVVLRVLGLDVLRLDAVALEGLDAFPGGLVEVLVVDRAGVGDESDAERLRRGAVLGGRRACRRSLVSPVLPPQPARTRARAAGAATRKGLAFIGVYSLGVCRMPPNASGENHALRPA